jgi:hypothetical protein
LSVLTGKEKEVYWDLPSTSRERPGGWRWRSAWDWPCWPVGRHGAGPGRSHSYGSSVTGSLTANAPFVIYSFGANAGDLISVVIAGLTPDMQPTANLLGADQRQVAISTGDPFSGAAAA